jgi:Fur family ferric uptake transcriptional regulator
VKCGKIEEFVDDVIESHQRDIAAKAGWTITDHTMVIYGLCSTCQ